MRRSKHTPGPWRVPAGSSLEIAIGMGTLIAIAAPRPNASANVRLIAAAPDLYRALSVILRETGEDGPTTLSAEAHELAAEALARADGDTP